MLVAHFQGPVKQARLPFTDKPRKANGCDDIGQGLVCAQVFDMVGGAEVFEFEAGLARFMFRPLDSCRAQRITHPGQVDQVPARVVVFVFAFIRVIKIPVEKVTAELIIETYTVVTGTTGTGFHHLSMYFCCELGFDHPLFQCFLRCDTGNQAGNRVRQHIRGRLAIPVDRITHLAQ